MMLNSILVHTQAIPLSWYFDSYCVVIIDGKVLFEVKALRRYKNSSIICFKLKIILSIHENWVLNYVINGYTIHKF